MDATNLRSEVPIGARVRRGLWLGGTAPRCLLDPLRVFWAYPTVTYRRDDDGESTVLMGATLLE